MTTTRRTTAERIAIAEAQARHMGNIEPFMHLIASVQEQDDFRAERLVGDAMKAMAAELELGTAAS